MFLNARLWLECFGNDFCTKIVGSITVVIGLTGGPVVAVVIFQSPLVGECEVAGDGFGR